jgi:hypothetical protein
MIAYDNRKYTVGEIEKAKYISEKLIKLLEKAPFSATFDAVFGAMLGWAMNQGYSSADVIERFRFLVKNDSPDGRTSDELHAAFKKEGGSAS